VLDEGVRSDVAVVGVPDGMDVAEVFEPAFQGDDAGLVGVGLDPTLGELAFHGIEVGLDELLLVLDEGIDDGSSYRMLMRALAISAWPASMGWMLAFCMKPWPPGVEPHLAWMLRTPALRTWAA